jgi:hypothetical protein
MVLMSAGKAARNQASIVNRPTCGGNKKAGLMTYTNLRGAHSIVGKRFCGRFANCLPRDKKCHPKFVSKTFPNSGGVGKTKVLTTRGRGPFVV